MKSKRTVRRTRLYTILGVIALASVIFLCFQLFSAEVLSLQDKEVGDKLKKNTINAELAKEQLIPVHKNNCRGGKGVGCKIQVDMKEEINPKFKWVEAEVENERELDVYVKNNQRQDNGEKEAKESERREEEVEMLNFPRGIPYDLRDSYKPDAQSMFTCIHSKVRIPFSRVNDDYCDCPDSSDEPGTSACPDSKFYCQFQLSWSDSTWFRSSRVNDGVCDCCDGSDEWLNLPLPPHVKISDSKNPYRVRQSPCDDRCEELRAQLASDQLLREKGRKKQREYIEAAKIMKNPGQLYGPDGVFYTLSLTCYEFHFDKYFYRVCPFSKVEQRDGPKITVIGRQPSWSIHREDKYKLRMSNGDSHGCPENRPRTSVINFSCGLEDVVTSIHEFEVCEYLVEFTTPAAC